VELCGKEHAYMPIHVKVLSAEDYSRWVAERKQATQANAQADAPGKTWEQAELMARGAQVYAANCAACHQANGKGAGPIKPLDGSPVVLAAQKAEQLKVVLAGRNNAMPSWKHLSDVDIAAVVTFTKNSWGNHTGQRVQPAEVLALR